MKDIRALNQRWFGAATAAPGPWSRASRVGRIDRVGERAALALFVSNVLEQAQAGKIQEAESAAVCRMLDQAGYAHLKVSGTGRVANLHGYPRAVTS